MRHFVTSAALAVLLLLASPVVTLSGERLDLGGLLNEALENNPELNALRERVSALEARARAEGRLDDPNLRVEFEDLSTSRPLDLSPDDAMLTKYTISQMFPFPGKLLLREKIARKEALSARAALGSREQEISEMVKEAFFEYAFLEESIRINTGIKGLLTDAAKTAEARYATGQAPQQDVIKLSVERSFVTNEIIALESEREVSAAKLKSLLNRDQTSGLLPPGELPKGKTGFDIAELTDRAVTASPDVLMMEAEAQAGELGVELARRNYYPDLMVGVSPVQRDGRFDNYGLMFQVNIPVWRGKYDSLSQEARASAAAARMRLAGERNRKGFEVKRAAVQVEAADRARELFETTLLPQVELSYESALRSYQTGGADLLTLLDAERELRRTRLEYLKAILDYNKRIAALERAAGSDITKGAASSQGTAKITE